MVLKLMFLLFQMVLSIDIADCATAIFILIEVPSLLKVDPSYMEESTSSRF